MGTSFLKNDIADCLNREELSGLEGQTILITGATGLIGKTVIAALLFYNETMASIPIRLIASVRNREKAESFFGTPAHLQYVIGDIRELPLENLDVQYIIHGASVTSSREFVVHPVETIKTAIEGTARVLEFARRNPVKSFVYLSSMEVYGAPGTDEKIDENHAANLNTMEVRTAYPESKRMCENLCASYYSEYQVPVRVIRLTQTFGPGVAYEDGRVFAEFARCAVEKKDIILHTKGETRRCYLYNLDAVTAIIKVLLCGTDGEAYNAANEDSYCSIYEMARMVAETFGEGELAVRIECEESAAERGYAPELKMNLSVEKLRLLGWEPRYDLTHMFRGIIAAWGVTV